MAAEVVPVAEVVTIAPVQAVPAVSSSDTFGGSDILLVKQEFDLKDACGIEAKNRYRVSVPSDVSGSTEGTVFLFGQEQSEGCERVCCPLCRSLTMNIHVGDNKHGNIAMSIEKPDCHPQALPWPLLLHPALTIPLGILACVSVNGPGAIYVVKDSSGAVLGSIVSPMMATFCCSGMQIIKDKDGLEVYRMGPSSQCNSCCPCLNDEAVGIFKDGAEVATVTRKTLTCAEVCGKTNRFSVDFRKVTNLDQRRLIFAAAMSYDLQFWEFK